MKSLQTSQFRFSVFSWLFLLFLTCDISHRTQTTNKVTVELSKRAVSNSIYLAKFLFVSSKRPFTQPLPKSTVSSLFSLEEDRQTIRRLKSLNVYTPPQSKILHFRSRTLSAGFSDDPANSFA